MSNHKSGESRVSYQKLVINKLSYLIYIYINQLILLNE